MARAHDGLLHGEANTGFVQAQRALADLGFDIAQTTLDASRSQLTLAWDEELQARPGRSKQQRDIITANPTAEAHFMGLTVATGGDGPLGFLTRGMEFGTLNRDEYTTYSRRGRNGGARHDVRRRTKRQIPTRSTNGWIAYPAAARWTTRAVRMFQQIIVKVAHDAIDGGRRG